MQRCFVQILILMVMMLQVSYGQILTISGKLINGRGTTDKLENVRINFYLNSELLGAEYTDEQGHFQYGATNIENGSPAPIDYFLSQNYPNPFNPVTTIAYSLDRQGFVSLEIFNIIGQKVRTLISEDQPPGTHSAVWNGTNDAGRRCRSGTYFYRFRFNRHSEIKKMCFLNMPANFSGSISPFKQNFLTKQFDTNLLEIEITNRDIEDTTLVFNFEQMPTNLDINEVQIHVYPFIRIQPDTLSLMSGENVCDTVDVYFERPIEVSSPHLEIDWNFTSDSLIEVVYQNVAIKSAWLKVKEISSSKSGYANVYFDLSPRLGLAKAQFHRGYVGISYFEQVNVKNAAGEYELNYENGLPFSLDYANATITGIPQNVVEAPIYFSLLDERNILVSDSAKLIIRQPIDINLNEYAIEKLETYPTDGAHPYSWVGAYDGVTEDIFYKGQRIARANPNGSKSCFCCGLTFEVFFNAMQQLNSDLGNGEDVNGMTVSEIRNFLHLWFVLDLWGDGPGAAMQAYGIGSVIANWEDVQSGDFVQLWRTTGSGHSVIFINWITNNSDEKVGIRYWSTQGSTNGINYNTEYFTGAGGSIDPKFIYFSRLHSPENFIPFSRATLSEQNINVDLNQPILRKEFMNNE